MKKVCKTVLAVMLGCSMVGMTGCSSMTNLGKGALIGGGGGTALGAGIGALAGGGKGAGIGAAIGAVVGTGAGALIGRHMDKQAAKLKEELANKATVEEVQDQNGLKAIKVTFEGGILFPTGKYTLNNQAKADLTKFAATLNSNPDTNVQIYGFTDNTGTYAVNEKLAGERASAVLSYLANSGVSPTRLRSQGIPMADYVASNDTPAGRAQNRRVEVYISANEQMIQKAENGTLQ